MGQGCCSDPTDLNMRISPCSAVEGCPLMQRDNLPGHLDCWTGITVSARAARVALQPEWRPPRLELGFVASPAIWDHPVAS